MKNKVAAFFYIILWIPFLFSCTKSGTVSGGSNSLNSSNITPSNATSYDAILSITGLQLLSNGNLSPMTNICQAYFSNTLTPIVNTATFVKVTRARINGTDLKFTGYQYEDTTYQVTYPPGTWAIDGLANIPSFTFTTNASMPMYTGYALLPDTIHVNQAVTINISGLHGSDVTNVIISDGSNANGHIVAQVLAPGATSVTFPASSLSVLTAGVANAFINVACIKNQAMSVNNVPMNFSMGYQLNKRIIIK